MTNRANKERATSARFTERVGAIAVGATFNLVYLVFLFFPWMFQAPTVTDVLVGAVAILLFVPIHYYAYNAVDDKRIVPIAGVALIGVACNFFMLGAGVFQIYCGAMAGFCRPVQRSGLVLALSTAVYVLGAMLADRALTEIGFVLLMTGIVWFSTMSTAQSMIDKAQLQREHELDTQTASLLERERIGRDLHDLLGHTLTMVALKSDLANRLIDSDPNKAKEQIEEIQQGARRALKDVRVALSGLAAVSVATELENARKALESANVELHVTGHIPALSPEQDQVCGMMIREAVTNIIRHTKATEARIEFSSNNEEERLTVSDNGNGKVGTEGRGLNGLRKRIESIGGSVRITDSNGVSLSATLPTVSL